MSDQTASSTVIRRKALRHARRLVGGGGLAARARCAGCAACALVRAMPWLVRMGFADPAAVIANEARHLWPFPRDASAFQSDNPVRAQRSRGTRPSRRWRLVSSLEHHTNSTQQIGLKVDTLRNLPAPVKSYKCHRALISSRQRHYFVEAEALKPPMEQPQHQQSRCPKCGEQSDLRRTILDTRTGQTFHMYLCRCGRLSWTSDATVRQTATSSRPLIVRANSSTV